MQKAPVRLLWLTLLAPIGYLLQQITAKVPYLIETVYVPSIYVPLTKLSSRISGLVPFSIAEIGLILLVILVPTLFLRHLIHGIRKKNFQRLFTYLIHIVVISSIWYFLSVPAWTLNYNRPSIAELTGLSIKPSSAEELERVSEVLIEKVNQLRDLVVEDETGYMQLNDTGNQFLTRSIAGYHAVSDQFPFLGGLYGNPKPVLLSELLSRTHIVGIYTLTTAEANVDIHIPPLFRPSTAMHELAHMRGIAREDEANFVAWLTCNAHPDVDFQYSGNVLALIHVSNALYSADADAYTRIYSQFGEGLRRDLEREHQYWKHYESVVNKVAEATNDAYLKFNGQVDGVKSYGRMVDLMLAEFRDNPSLQP